MRDQRANLLFNYTDVDNSNEKWETTFPMKNMNSTKKSTILPIFYFPGPDTL